jgi:hypothetical protein
LGKTPDLQIEREEMETKSKKRLICNPPNLRTLNFQPSTVEAKVPHGANNPIETITHQKKLLPAESNARKRLEHF